MRNVMLIGGIYHPFEEAAPVLAGLLESLDIESVITSDVSEAVAELEGADLFALPADTGIERGGGLRVTRIFEAEAIPRHTGVLGIPELRVSWFDSAAGAYRFESAPPLALRVDSPRSEATDRPGETRRQST